jgi:heterodisulfide reductase subunit A-like polyferredoxin
MEIMERRIFLGKAGRFVLGLGALGLTGALASCSSGSDTGTSAGEATQPQTADDGYTAGSGETTTLLRATVTAKCVGCGKCTRGVCDVNAISLSGKTAVIGEACRGCGDCVRFCPAGAIVLSQVSRESTPLESAGSDGFFAALSRP